MLIQTNLLILEEKSEGDYSLQITKPMNLLFVCSRNEWRSRTAETIFKDDQQHTVRSAGTAANARIRVSEKLIA